MKHIAIIGSGSFLARNFITYCLNNGTDYKFDLYNQTKRNGFKEIPVNGIDFGDINSVRTINFNVDAIMVFIGKTGTINGFDDYQQFIEVNEIMLLNILKAYAENNSKALIIYPSTRLIFRSNEMQGITEESERECKSIYAVTKYAAEEYLKLYKIIYGLSYVILRICTPIGSLLNDFGNYGTFEIFKNQALEKGEITVFGDGKQKKTFTSIVDICKAFKLIIDKGQTDFADYNLGGQDLQLIDIAQSIADEYNAQVKHVDWPSIYKKVDGGSVVFNSSRFDKEFLMKYEMLL